CSSDLVTTGGFCHQPDVYTVYFAARFSRPFTSTGTWRLETGMPAGAWLDFGSTRDRGVGMQVAISYVSTQGALGNLAAEAHTWSVKPVAALATTAWNTQLGTIFVGRGSRL